MHNWPSYNPQYNSLLFLSQSVCRRLTNFISVRYTEIGYALHLLTSTVCRMVKLVSVFGLNSTKWRWWMPSGESQTKSACGLFWGLTMNASRQEKTRRGTCPSGNVVKCFVHLVVTTKRSVDELFMHYFHNLSSASGGKGDQTPTGALSLDPLGDFRPLTPNLLTPWRNPAGAHGVDGCLTLCYIYEMNWI